jgi:oxygen-dependent protoporphyrinogen oxidase
VIGGGITGLATAWYLESGAASAEQPPEVTILEAGERLGGKIRTEELAGVPVEVGPDTFLARVPWAVDLCRGVGLGDDLVAPATDKAYVWSRGRLRPLPSGIVLGVPTRLGALVGSGILSSRGAARAAVDLVSPRRQRSPDPSVADVIDERLGREARELLVEPLVGGINAGVAEHLSLRSAARQLATSAEHSRSLILGARRQRRHATASGSGPVFQSVRGGLGRLVERLTEAIAGAELRTRTSVSSIEPSDDRCWRVHCEPGPDVTADAVVLTVPAGAAAGILRATAPVAASDLDGIHYASVVTSTMVYEPAAVGTPLDGSGFLVPRTSGSLTTACTWSTSKWPDLRRSGKVLLRPSAGRFADDRAMQLDDDELIDRLHEELAGILHLNARPTDVLVSRWPHSFPQYEPGHEARIARVETALAADAPGVLVAGAAYDGLGIASCIRQAEQAAGRVAAILSHRSATAAFHAPKVE